MWASLLFLALLVAVNPVLLGVILLMISRRRPVQNLLAYWLGGLTIWAPGLLVPLVLLRSTPRFKSFAQNFATPSESGNSASQYVQIGIGVFALSVAALMTLRSRRHQRAQLSPPARSASIVVLESDLPTGISPTEDSAKDAPTQVGSIFRRLRVYAQNAWENGSSWVAFLIGLGSLPPPVLVLLVDTTIVASGASLNTQVSAVFAFIIGMFAIVEITLISHLAAPAKTQAILRPLHAWTLIHRRKILIAIFSLIGLVQLSNGISTV